MKRRTAILIVALIATIGVAKWSTIARRQAKFDLFIEQVYALKPGGHFEVTFD